jgi:hypothetical protein
MASKGDLAVIAAIVAGCALWIERGHRITIDAPTPSELAAASTAPSWSASSASSCPDNDRGPYSEGCLAFLKGAGDATIGWRIASTDRKPKGLFNPPKSIELNAAACPDNDNVPYPPDCLKFLSGPLWRPE